MPLSSSFKPLAASVLSVTLLGACAHQSRQAEIQDLFDLPVQSAPEVAGKAAVLAGELALQRGMVAQAAAHYVEAAKQIEDAELAERAVRLSLGAGDLDLSASALDRWLAITPQNITALEIGARVALRQSSYDLAAQRLQSLMPLLNEHGHIRAAQILASESLPSEKAKALWAALPADDDAARRLYAEALLAVAWDEVSLAQQKLSEALILRPDWRDARLLALRLHLQRSEVLQAGLILKQLHVADPTDVALRLSLGRLLLEFEQLDLARKEFRNVLKLEAGQEDARYALALIAVDLGEYDEAESLFEALVDDQLRVEDSAFYLGRIAEFQQRPAQALKWYRQVTRGSRVFEAALRQSIVLARLGELNAAREYLAALRRSFPQRGDQLFQAEGELLYRADEFAAARDVYEQALLQYPDDADLRYGLALTHERLGEIHPAMQALQEIIAQNDEDARALNALGYMLSNHTDRYEEAMGYVKKALAITPNDAAVIDSVGWLYFRQGDLQQAHEYLSRAFEKLQDPEVAAHLGEVLWQLGDKVQARKIWRDALSREPEHPALTETIRRLDQAPAKQSNNEI